MAQKPITLGGVVLGTTATTIATVADKTRIIIQKLTLCNTSASAAAEVKIWLVPSGEAAADKYLIAQETLSAGETWPCPGIERLVGLAGATIQGTSNPATINANGAALEVT